MFLRDSIGGGDSGVKKPLINFLSTLNLSVDYNGTAVSEANSMSRKLNHLITLPEVTDLPKLSK
jgi:hypothetical protein